MIATSLSLAPAPLMQTPPLESGGSSASPFGAVLAALSAPIAAPVVPALDSLLPSDGVSDLASSPPPPVDMTPPGALVVPPVLRRTMILLAGDDMPASQGSDESISTGSDEADAGEATGETMDVQTQSIASLPTMHIVTAAPLPVAEPATDESATGDTSIVAASTTTRNAQPAVVTLPDRPADRTIQAAVGAAGIVARREVGSSTQAATDSDPAARGAIDAGPPPRADAGPLSGGSQFAPLDQNGLAERNVAPTSRLRGASFASAPQAAVAGAPTSARMAAAIPLRTKESMDDLSRPDMPIDVVSGPVAGIMSAPRWPQRTAGESPARNMAVGGEAVPAPAIANGDAGLPMDAAPVAGSMLATQAPEPAPRSGAVPAPPTAGQASAARQALNGPDESVTPAADAGDVARAAPVSMADRIAVAPALSTETITGATPSEPADDNDIVATTGIDLNAIFPASGDAPLTVAFVRPPAARAVADRASKAGADPATPGERPAAIDKAAAALPTPTIDAGVIAAAVQATPAHVSVAQGDGAAAPGSGVAAEVVVQHHLDVAHDSAWLDRLARDIAVSADKDMRMRFQLNPERLGSLHVEIAQVADGASVRFRADSEAARALIADAQPMLVAEARAHGMRIAETQVEVGSRNVSTGGAQQGGTDGGFGQQPHQHGQTPSRSFDRAAALTTRSTPGQPAASAARAERYA